MTKIYPTLVSGKLKETVNFYEDFFGFIALIEKEGFVLLQCAEDPSTRIAVFDEGHACVAGRVHSVQGLILSMEVKDARAVYDKLYMEGLDLYKDYGEDIHGQKHFVVCDPNGVLVNVHEPTTVPQFQPF